MSRREQEAGLRQCHRSRPIPPFLIGGETLTVDELLLEVRKGFVIELELPLERAIGYPPPLAQEGDHLIHHRHKVHPVSSLSGVLSGVHMGALTI